MSLSKVTSSKSRDLYDHHGVSSFERATLIFKEIEAFIDNELADTPIISASYEIPRMKSKRKRGPFLIKPLNKSKARKTLNDMEYDPVRMEWAGNAGALKTFAGVRPGLIANKANSYKPPTDEMIWNAKEQRWEGNWDDLRSFETRKPHLIKSIPSVALPKDRDGMSYNPITMTWDGNSDVLLAFGPISLESSTPDDGFKVGVEFQLTPATVQLFADCAARHNTNTNGWWRDEKTREHLAVIRTMSIMRLVRDVKRAAFAFEEPSYMDIASEREPPLKLKSPHAEPEVDFDDAWEDIGPFTGTVRVKLPESNTSDIDFGLEELSKFGSIRNSKQAVADEDWDGDFAEDLSKILPRKLSTHKPIPSFTPPSNNSNNDLLTTTPPLNPSVSTIPVQSNSNSNPVSLSSSTSSTSSSSSTNGTVTQLGKGSITEKKPFALLKADAPHRKSYHDLSAARASPKVAWDEDEEDGFEISNNAPLRLKVPGSGGVLSSSSSTVASEDDVDGDFDDDDDDTVPSEPNYPEEDEGEVVEVEDDDWNDVELPPTLALGEPVTKRGTVQQLQQQQQYQPPEKEEWDEFEISAEKLELKLNQRKQQQQQNQQHQQHKKHHKGKAEEEELDGLEIPDGFQLRLKR